MKGNKKSSTFRCGPPQYGERLVSMPVWMENSEGWQDLLEMILEKYIETNRLLQNLRYLWGISYFCRIEWRNNILPYSFQDYSSYSVESMVKDFKGRKQFEDYSNNPNKK